VEIERFGQIYGLHRCQDCGLVVTSPSPTRELLAKLYASTTYRAHERRFIQLIERLIRRFRNSRYKQIERLRAPGRWLDIGCGRGLVLATAREAGWETYGLEFSEDSAHHARDVLGLDVRTGDIEDAGFHEGTFDVITIWHVLEHLECPAATIRACSRLLKHGGTLALAIPNFESLQAILSGRYWFHLDIPYHLFHFSTPNIVRLLEQTGFRVERVKHFSFEQNPFGCLQSMLNATGIRNNLLYDILKTGDLRTRLRSGRAIAEIAVVLVLLPVAVPISVTMAVLEALMRRGGTIEIRASRMENCTAPHMSVSG
jgi:2-polyprenyl-3-methyl-5-hydroxy-6-metoxy-1,4-benzoquinol methylase